MAKYIYIYIFYSIITFYFLSKIAGEAVPHLPPLTACLCKNCYQANRWRWFSLSIVGVIGIFALRELDCVKVVGSNMVAFLYHSGVEDGGK